MNAGKKSLILCPFTCHSLPSRFPSLLSTLAAQRSRARRASAGEGKRSRKETGVASEGGIRSVQGRSSFLISFSLYTPDQEMMTIKVKLKKSFKYFLNLNNNFLNFYFLLISSRRRPDRVGTRPSGPSLRVPSRSLRGEESRERESSESKE